MRSALLGSLVLVMLAGCRVGDTTTPMTATPGSPLHAVSDGANVDGNPEFFFLPPMAKDPSTNPNYEATAFNPNLKPEVRICALQLVGSVYSCNTGVYALTQPAVVTDGKYAYNWSVPRDGASLYRVGVFLDGTQLGYSDVSTDKTDLFIVINEGRTLPIKFRIERNEHCVSTATAPCSSKTINLADGGTVTTDLGGGPAGIIIPPQTRNFVTTITVKGCSDLNPVVTDLPTFGPCTRVTASPVIPPLTSASSAMLSSPATVFICAVPSLLSGIASHEQTELITMHRYDAPNRLAALPHAQACGYPALTQGTVTNLVRDLSHGAYASAGRELFAMIAPKNLEAAPRFIDVGPGAFTLEFSDFQFALPSKLTLDAEASLPTVVVRDLNGEAVNKARVRFAASASACAGLAAGSGTESGTAGQVSTAAAGMAVACGRGLAGTDNNGPRDGIDPFQPLSIHFLDASNGPEVLVRTGAIPLVPTVVTLGSNGYLTYGPFTRPTTGPAGWPNVTAGTTQSTTLGNKAPFLTDASCGKPANYTGPLAFTLNSDIFVTKAVDLPVGGTLEITVLIDNDLRLYVDGVEHTSEILTTPGRGAYNATSQFWVHENCVTEGPAVLKLTGVSAGTHTIALWGSDRGGDAFLDMQVVLK